jgi:hypothetical protein
MRSTKPMPRRGKTVSPVVAIIVIVAFIGGLIVVGINLMKPKGDTFTGHGNKAVYQQREKNAQIWAAELKKAAAEHRAPNTDLQPVLSPGTAETIGSLKRKGLWKDRGGPSMQFPPGAYATGK